MATRTTLLKKLLKLVSKNAPAKIATLAVKAAPVALGAGLGAGLDAALGDETNGSTVAGATLGGALGYMASKRYMTPVISEFLKRSVHKPITGTPMTLLKSSLRGNLKDSASHLKRLVKSDINNMKDGVLWNTPVVLLPANMGRSLLAIPPIPTSAILNGPSWMPRTSMNNIANALGKLPTTVGKLPGEQKAAIAGGILGGLVSLPIAIQLQREENERLKKLSAKKEREGHKRTGLLFDKEDLEVVLADVRREISS